MPNSFSLFLIYERALKDGYISTKFTLPLVIYPIKILNYAFTVDIKDNLRSRYLVSKKKELYVALGHL